MWNTYNCKYLNGFSRSNGPEVIFVFEDGKDRVEECRWKNLHRIGPHALDGSYSRITLDILGRKVQIEGSSCDDALVCRLKLCEGEGRGIKVMVKKLNDPEEKFQFHGVPSTFKLEPNSRVILVCSSQEWPSYSQTALEGIIEEKRSLYLRNRVCGDGLVSGCAEAMIEAIAWNTIYKPNYPHICSPVSREWCVAWGGYVLFDWDTFFTALMVGAEDKELAYSNVRAILSEVTERGFVPNFGSSSCKSEDRSQPPVGGYCVLKIYLQHRDIRLLEEAYPSLKKWHEWWFNYRDGNRNGLLEWGSDTGGLERWQYHNLQAAKFESGLDNSPMYDDVSFNEKTNTMELDDVGLNSLYALDAWALSEIAAELDQYEDESKYLEEYLRMRKSVNALLWNEEAGIYQNRFWDGRFSERLSPTCFYPLIAGIPSIERARKMVNEHLLNESEFWGKFVIPSISKKDPAFADNTYWRGRIWAPMNFLVYEGLKRYGFESVAHEFAVKSIELFRGEWEKEGHVHENYNATTGEGDDVRSSDPLYTWGGLLSYIGIEELVMAEPWNRQIRFGHFQEKEASVKNYRALGSNWDIESSNKGIVVTRDGVEIIRSAGPIALNPGSYDK